MNKWLSNKDVLVGGFLTLFSIWFYFTAQAIPAGNITGMPPSFFPSFLAVCLGIFSVALLGKGLKDVLAGNTVAATQAKNHKIVLILIAFLIAYIILLNLIGFIATTFLYLAGLMLLLQAGKLIKVIPISAVITLVIYIVFAKMFNIPLP